MSSRPARGASNNAGSPSHSDAERPPSSGRYLRDVAPLSSIRPILSKARLLETRYCTLEWDGRRSLVRFVRNELRYSTIADIEEDGIAIQRMLDDMGKVRLLVDLRRVMLRNDPSFEVAIADFRRRVLSGRRQVAILVRTAVGALQVRRHMREDGLTVEAFTCEDEALAYFEMRSSERTPSVRHDAPAPRSRSWL